jgi:hypothetical protein
MNEIHICEVCGNSDMDPILNLGTHPLCDDLVEVGDNRVCKEYPIEILFCSNCKTAHQRFQVPKYELFPKSYHYRSRFTADVLNGMEVLVDSCIHHFGSLSGKVVLDIGCNDGSLLGFFQNKGAITIGIEPTDAYLDGMGKGHEVVNGFFSPETAITILEKFGSPHIITFTNVFAHIENLPELIRALNILISEHTVVVIENHYLGAVIGRNQFDTFYHEHPRTYSLTSFYRIAETLGRRVNSVEFPSRYGGNIRVFLGAATTVDIENNLFVSDVMKSEGGFSDALKQMQSGIEVWRKSMRAQIVNLVETHGKLSAKAFPGRAAILVKLLGLDIDLIDVVYEKPGSMKIGHYIPGTRIPIRSDDDFLALEKKPPVILNLAWHISTEIHSYLRKNGYEGEIVDILSVEQVV